VPLHHTHRRHRRDAWYHRWGT